MRWSYKRSTALICSINALAAFYVLHSLLGARTIQPRSRSIALLNGRLLPNGTVLPSVVRYTVDEFERIKEAHEARRSVEPRDLIKRIKEIQLESVEELLRDKHAVAVKQKVAADLVQRLKELQGNNPRTQQDALDEWRRKKMKQAGRQEDLGTAKEENEIDKGAQEEVGVTLSDDKLQGGKLLLKGPEIEDGIIPGRPLPTECNAEPHTDYDGVAVKWGLTHPQESAADCCQACLDQAKTAKGGDMKCNVWVYCPAEEGCFSPDIYEHKQFECWLKQTEKPTLNFKGQYSPEYREMHPNCPQVVAWVSGVLSPA